MMTKLSFRCALALLGTLTASGLWAQPQDGTYDGTTGQGRNVSVVVAGGEVTMWSLGFQCGGTSGTTNVQPGSCPIVGNSFDCGSASCIPFGTTSEISGTFSGDTVSGSFTLRTQPGLSGCCTLDASFSAALVVPGMCQPAAALACGSSDLWSNDGAGSTDEVSAYACNPFNYSGPEYTYSFDAQESIEVRVSLAGLSDDLDLLVLQDGGSGCNPSTCLAASTQIGTAEEEVSFSATAGETYYVVVEGFSGATSSYSIRLSCPIFTDGFESGDVSAWGSVAQKASE